MQAFIIDDSEESDQEAIACFAFGVSGIRTTFREASTPSVIVVAQSLQSQKRSERPAAFLG